MAESESGGPGSYEEWMLGNLQRAFAEVDWFRQSSAGPPQAILRPETPGGEHLRGGPIITSFSGHPAGWKG
jgi:hypothetical protein